MTVRIAIVSLYPADPARITGGMRAVAYLLAEGLRRRPGLDVHVIHCHSDLEEDRTLSVPGLTVHYLGQSRRRLAPNMLTGVSRIAARLRSLAPDVVNTHNSNYTAAALAAGFSPVWTIHGLMHVEAHYQTGLFHRLAYMLATRYERRALNGVRDITAINPYIRDYYAGRTSARWHLTENPAPDDLFDLPRCPVPGRLLLPASVIPLKDPLTLIAAVAIAARQLHELHLQIAGRATDTAYVARVREACRKQGVADRVQILGLQSQAEMRRLYTEAQLVVLSSRQEVSPMALIEAMAAGIPAVTTAAGGAPYIVDDGRTGRVVPVGDAPALASAICDLLHSPGRYAEMSQAARTAAAAHFRLDRVVDAYLAAYGLAAGGA